MFCMFKFSTTNVWQTNVARKQPTDYWKSTTWPWRVVVCALKNSKKLSTTISQSINQSINHLFAHNTPINETTRTSRRDEQDSQAPGALMATFIKQTKFRKTVVKRLKRLKRVQLSTRKPSWRKGYARQRRHSKMAAGKDGRKPPSWILSNRK